MYSEGFLVMPDRCCVPECRSNYDGEVYCTVFQFPSQKRDHVLREKWIRIIPRRDWVPTKRSVVCIKHFQEDDVISSDKFIDESGVQHIVQRRCPVLKPDAYPTVFPCLPSYLSTQPVVRRNDPNKRTVEANKRHDIAVLEWLESDMIRDFKSLHGNYETKLEQQFKGPWHHISKINEYVLLYTVDLEPNRVPAIDISIRITQDFSFKVYLKTELIDTKSFKWLSSNGKIERWSQVENLVSYCLCQDIEAKVTVNDYLTKAHENLVQAINVLSISSNSECAVTDKNLQFLDEQLMLMRAHDSRKRYSCCTQCFTFMAYVKSPACYRFLRKSKFLSLPHPQA